MKFSIPRTILFALFSIFFLQLSAQDLRTVVENDPSQAHTVYQPYSPREGEMTPAPRGFKPFYISHYGRHGSRYYTSESYFREGEKGLTAMKEAGMLSEDGMKLYDDFFRLKSAHEGMYGELTPRGADEHRAIASRMYGRFSRVFRRRSKVECVASVVPRCLVSMANFTTALKGMEPSLEMTFTTGQKYFQLLARDFGGGGLFEDVARRDDSLGRAVSRYDKLYSRIFKDKEAAIAIMDDPFSLAHGLYIAGCICPDVDFLGIDLFSYFEPDELASFAIPLNNRIYGDFGNSVEWGHQVKVSARELARDFVEKADAAISKDSQVAADLRFGHDSGIMPLLDLLELDGCEVRTRIADADKVWMAHYMIPMATNFQMIFYRNCKDEILVKMLYNEAETSIKGVPAYNGPYYRWSDLRNWFLSR